MVVGLSLAAGLAVMLIAGPTPTRRPGISVEIARLTRPAVRRLRARWETLQVERRLQRATPEVVELVGLALGSGLDVDGALELVFECGPAAFEDLVALTSAELRAGVPRRRALVTLAQSSAGNLGPLVDVLLAAEREGAPVALVLDRLAGEAAARRRALAHERARRTPVLLLAPLVLCSLPAVLLGTIVPLLVITLGDRPL